LLVEVARHLEQIADMANVAFLFALPERDVDEFVGDVVGAEPVNRADAVVATDALRGEDVEAPSLERVDGLAIPFLRAKDSLRSGVNA
jgi:hypothetical protein